MKHCLFRISLAVLCINNVIQGFTPYTFSSTRRNSLTRIRVRLPLSLSSSTSNNEEGIRLNKVFKATHSRREADDLIASGRVSVNGEPVLSKGGFKVIPFQDVIQLDGNVVKGWEKMNVLEPNPNGKGGSTLGENVQSSLKMEQFEYVKYFKPLGVTCTTDLRVNDNIIDSIEMNGYRPRHRVYPVGRLDKETSGLIILTSDGRLVNSVLRGEKKQPKVYKVKVDRRLEDHHLQRLRDGVTITTVSQRKGRSLDQNTLVAKTKLCEVERIGPYSCQMTLVEGRNRQIRKMMQALGCTVVRLHRIEFMGIHLEETRNSEGLEGPGNWACLDAEEMKLVEKALRAAQEEDS